MRKWNKKWLVIILLCVMQAAACGRQNIKEDTNQWIRFDVTVDKYNAQYAVPPGGRISSYPPKDVDFSKYEAPGIVIGFFGYDYSSKTSWDPAEFWVVFSIIKFADDRRLDQSSETFMDLVKQSTSRRSNDVIFSEELINNKKWVHGMIESGMGEGYFYPINNEYFLVVAGTYHEKVRADPEWLMSRRNILKKVVEQVEIKRLLR